MAIGKCDVIECEAEAVFRKIVDVPILGQVEVYFCPKHAESIENGEWRIKPVGQD